MQSMDTPDGGHRPLVRETTLAEYRKEPDFAKDSTHGRSGVGKLLMGSVAENIFRHSPVPVLTIGPHVQRSGHPPAIKNILLPVDFSRGPERAVHYACALARERSATITALHVLEPGVLKSTTPDRAHATDEIKTWLTKLVDCESSGTHYSLRVESGESKRPFCTRRKRPLRTW